MMSSMLSVMDSDIVPHFQRNTSLRSTNSSMKPLETNQTVLLLFASCKACINGQSDVDIPNALVSFDCERQCCLLHVGFAVVDQHTLTTG
jgi:hypothetical protein